MTKILYNLRQKKQLFLSLFLMSCLLSFEAGAVPAPNKPIQVTQADGSVLTLQIQGDEYVSWVTTLDGYSVMQTQDGFYEYIDRIENGKRISSGIRVTQAEQRTPTVKRRLQKIVKHLKVVPDIKENELPVFKSATQGDKSQKVNDEKSWLMENMGFAKRKTLKTLLVLVNFPDQALTYEKASFDSAFNGLNYTGQGNHGSVRDFFYDMSNGKFTYQASTILEYTAKQNSTKYGKYAEDLKNEVLRYAQRVLKDKILDFDANADGIIDHISIIFAGKGQELTANELQIWSHCGDREIDGQVINYAVISEIDNYENRLGIATYCHEFGHVLGLPDLYDSDGETEGESEHPNVHDLMACNNGDGHPVPISAFIRYTLGWVNLKPIEQAATLSLNDILEEEQFFRVNTKVNGEFFVLEQRSPTNKWQSNPEQGHGMLIFRVDSAYWRAPVMVGLGNTTTRLAANKINANADHLGYAVEYADNTSDWQSQKSDFYPCGDKYRTFSDLTTPSAKSLTGANTEKPIQNIQEVNGSITFDFIQATEVLWASTHQATFLRPNTIHVKASVIGNKAHTEKGVCYGALNNPTVNGKKKVSDSAVNILNFEIDIDTLISGNTYYVRTYAKDTKGNVSYGNSIKVQLDMLVEVDSLYSTQKFLFEDYGVGSGSFLGLEEKVDFSNVKNPVMELYTSKTDLQETWVTGGVNSPRYILVFYEDQWHIIEACDWSYTLEDKNHPCRITFPLPSGVGFCRIAIPGLIRGGMYSSADSVIIRKGDTKSFTPLPYSDRAKQEPQSNSSLTKVYPQKNGIFKINTMDCKQAILYIRSVEPNVFGKSHLSSYSNVLKDQLMTAMVDFKEIRNAENNRIEYFSSPKDYFYELPRDSAYTLFVSEYYELHLYDQCELAVLHSLTALSDTTVEVRGNYPFPVKEGEEVGICLNYTPEPSGTENSIVLNKKGLFTDAFRSVSSNKTAYIRTYAKINGHITYGPALSSLANAQGRENSIPLDTLNPIEVISVQNYPFSYTLRVRYNSALLGNQVVAQGILYANSSNNSYIPTENDLSVHREGAAHSVDYFSFTCPANQYNYQQTRPFALSSTDKYLYDRVQQQQSTGELVCELPLEIDLCLTIPFDFTKQSETAKEAWQGYGLIYSGTGANPYFEWHSQYTKNAPDTLQLRSPILIQKGGVNPMVSFFRKGYGNSENPSYYPTQFVSVYAVNVQNGEKFLLGTILPQYENLDLNYSFSTKAAGDSIYLVFETLNAENQLRLERFQIADIPTPTVKTDSLCVSEDSYNLSCYGNYISSASLAEVTECGFIYSTYGDPLLSVDGKRVFYDSIVSTADARGNFSGSLHSYTANVYVRAYAKNENGIAYGEIRTVYMDNEYLVTADALPITDPRAIDLYSENGEKYRWNFASGKSGILQLTNRPSVNKIKASFEIRMDGLPDTDPEDIAKQLDLFCMVEGSTEKIPLSEYTLNFIEVSPPYIGEILDKFKFSGEVNLPKVVTQLYAENKDRQTYVSFIAPIHYTESNIADITSAVPQISYLTVENKKIKINWVLQNLTNVASMRIYRESEQTGAFQQLKEYTLNELSSLSGVFEDTAAQPDRRSYTYVLKSVNSEGTEFAGTAHKSTHLSINKGIENQWNLYWNFYEGRKVSSVSIYRGSSTGNLEFIDRIAGSNNTYSDIDAPEGVLYYMIETVFEESSPFVYTKASLSSKSNIVNNSGVPLPMQYRVTYTQPEHGKISVLYNGNSVPSETYLDSATVLTLKITPDEKYTFVQWWDENKNAQRSYVLVADVVISAILKEIVGIEEIQTTQWGIYPNPVNSHLTVTDCQGKIELFNSQGVLLRLMMSKGDKTIIDVSDLNAGIYILRSKCGKKTFIKR